MFYEKTQPQFSNLSFLQYYASVKSPPNKSRSSFQAKVLFDPSINLGRLSKSISSGWACQLIVTKGRARTQYRFDWE